MPSFYLLRKEQVQYLTRVSNWGSSAVSVCYRVAGLQCSISQAYAAQGLSYLWAKWEWGFCSTIQTNRGQKKTLILWMTCFLRNLYAGQEATVRTGHGTTGWFQIGKEYVKAGYCHPVFFNLYAEYIMWSAGLDDSQAGIKIAGRNNNNLRYADDTTLNSRKWRETIEPLDESERGEWKSWLETQH